MENNLLKLRGVMFAGLIAATFHVSVTNAQQPADAPKPAAEAPAEVKEPEVDPLDELLKGNVASVVAALRMIGRPNQ